MTTAGAGRATETSADPQTDESRQSDAGTSEVEQIPDSAAIAQESAAIYPHTNEGSATPEEIAIEAYRIYMARGAQDGYDLEDWLEAERRLSQARRVNP